MSANGTNRSRGFRGLLTAVLVLGMLGGDSPPASAAPDPARPAIDSASFSPQQQAVVVWELTSVTILATKYFATVRDETVTSPLTSISQSDNQTFAKTAFTEGGSGKASVALALSYPTVAQGGAPFAVAAQAQASANWSAVLTKATGSAFGSAFLNAGAVGCPSTNKNDSVDAGPSGGKTFNVSPLTCSTTAPGSGTSFNVTIGASARASWSEPGSSSNIAAGEASVDITLTYTRRPERCLAPTTLLVSGAESCALSLLDLEVTQGLQNLESADKRVPLVERKRTYLRALVENAPGPLTNVSLRLIAVRPAESSAALPGSPLMPIDANGVGLPKLTVPKVSNRQSLADSVLFQLPPSWLTGTVQLTLMSETHPMSCPGSATATTTCAITVSFQSVGTPRMTFIPLVWTESGVKHEPTYTHIISAVRRLERMMPIAEIAWIAAPAVHVDTILGSPIGRPKTPEQFQALYSYVDGQRGLFCSKCNDYIGLLIDLPVLTPGVEGISKLNTGVYVSYFTESNTAFVHEFGHTSGRKHSNCLVNGEEVDDPNPNGTLSEQESGPSAQFGFNVDTREVYPAGTFEVMGYCGPPAWPNKLTYDRVLSAMASRFPKTALAPDLTASVSLTSVLNQPPVPWLRTPTDGLIVVGNQPLILDGRANDPEEGEIPASGLSWISDRSGALGAGKALQIDALSLLTGSHKITLTARDSTGLTATVSVNVQVLRTRPVMAPSLAPGPQFLSYSVPQGRTAPARLLAVRNGGDGGFSWTATASQPWIRLNATSGSAPADIAVSLDTKGFALGVYTGTIRLDAPGLVNSPRLVPVQVVIGAARGADVFIASAVKSAQNIAGPSPPTGTPGITGRITFNGAPVAGQTVTLRSCLSDFSGCQSIGTTSTAGDGGYRFSGVASLPAGRVAYVQWNNTANDTRFLAYFFGPTLLSYTAGTTVAGGDFDLKDIPLSAPANNSRLAPPVTFSWQSRGLSGESYQLVFLEDADTSKQFASSLLGNVGSAVFSSLLSGMTTSRTYRWFPRVYVNGVVGESFGDPFFARLIQFSTGTTSADPLPAGPRSNRDTPLKGINLPPVTDRLGW